MGKLMLDNVLEVARSGAGLSQRKLAQQAGTAQSVIARIELGETSPTLRTLERLLDAAGFDLALELQPKPVVDPQILDDVPRILALSPEDRLREVANLSRLITRARHD